MTRESAVSRATRHFDDGEFIEDLARRVAIRTESQVAESRAQLDVYLKDEIAPIMREGLQMMTGLFWDLAEDPAAARVSPDNVKEQA